MMIFGADPDVAEKPWVEDQPCYYISPPLYRLVNYFGYHAPVRMYQRWADEDRLIIARIMATRLEQGFTARTLEKMVDRFYQMGASESDTPSNTFASANVQIQLVDHAELLVADPVLDWLATGMPTSPVYDRQAVLALSSELTHRYPDVVASVLRRERGAEATAIMLRAAEQLVLWNLGAEGDARTLLLPLEGIDLPQELSTHRRSMQSLRRKGETIIHAIGNIPRKKHHNEWEGQGVPRQAITRPWD